MTEVSEISEIIDSKIKKLGEHIDSEYSELKKPDFSSIKANV